MLQLLEEDVKDARREECQSIKEKGPLVFFQFKEQNYKYSPGSNEVLNMEDVVELGLRAIGSNQVARHQWPRFNPEGCQTGCPTFSKTIVATSALESTSNNQILNPAIGRNCRKNAVEHAFANLQSPLLLKVLIRFSTNSSPQRPDPLCLQNSYGGGGARHIFHLNHVLHGHCMMLSS